MWPPSRSAARSASSRLTPRPARARRATSGAASRASRRRRTAAPQRPIAVRQTPLTATESPSPSSLVSVDSKLSRAPSAVRSTVATVPRSPDQAGEHRSPLLQPGARSGGPRRPARTPASRRAARRRCARRPRPPAGRGRCVPPSSIGARNRRTSSISPASRNAPARCGPPSSSTEAMPSSPSRSSASRTRAGSFSPVATTTSAPAISSASVAARGARARDDDDQPLLARLGDELRVERQARRRSRRRRARGWRATAGDAGGQLRVVGQRRADADRDGVDRGAPAVRARTAGLAGDPLRVAGVGGDLAVERHRRLEQHPRAAGARVLAERLVGQPRAARQLVAGVGDADLDALVAQDPQTAAARLLGRVVGADHDAREPGRDDRVGARRRLALVAAGLERHVERRAVRGRRRRRRDRLDLGVRAAVGAVPALAQDHAVARDDRAHDRVGLHVAQPVVGELDGTRRDVRGRCRSGRAARGPPSGGYAGAAAPTQAVDRHVRPGPLVGQRVVVEGPVEVELHRPGAMASTATR